jgi:hypothetical protein
MVLLGCSGNPNFGDDTTGDDSGMGSDSTNPTNDGSMPGDEQPVMVTGALATGITVTDLTVLQAVEVKVVSSGAMATKNAPLVAGRRGLVRAFFSLGSGWSPRKITGILTLHTAGTDHVFSAQMTPTAASSDGNFNSTFNFNADESAFGTDTTFLVQLYDQAASGTGPSSAQYPTSGTPASLGVTTTGGVKISVFPINFTGGGGSTPATGAIDMSAYQNVVLSMYPTTGVTLTLESPINYSGSVPQANGSNWSELLNTMIQKRSGDPSVDVYYYGAFAPTATFAQFCSSGCVAGLSSIPNSPSDSGQKASIGLVYGGDAASQQATGQTMTHEVGHGHGRSHAPTTYSIMGCSTPSGIDPSYPYTNGGIGVWGWDITGASSKDPTQNYDIMGYCAFDWISDYTYSALASWVATDNGADMILPSTPTRYRQIMVAADGTLTVGDAFPVYGIPSGANRKVTYQAGGVTRTVDGFFYPYDHLPGGYILAPEVMPFTSVQVLGYAKPASH